MYASFFFWYLRQNFQFWRFRSSCQWLLVPTRMIKRSLPCSTIPDRLLNSMLYVGSKFIIGSSTNHTQMLQCPSVYKLNPAFEGYVAKRSFLPQTLEEANQATTDHTHKHTCHTYTNNLRPGRLLFQSYAQLIMNYILCIVSLTTYHSFFDMVLYRWHYIAPNGVHQSTPIRTEYLTWQTSC